MQAANDFAVNGLAKIGNTLPWYAGRTTLALPVIKTTLTSRRSFNIRVTISGPDMTGIVMSDRTKAISSGYSKKQA